MSDKCSATNNYTFRYGDGEVDWLPYNPLNNEPINSPMNYSQESIGNYYLINID
jgi:hypothetical protein